MDRNEILQELRRYAEHFDEGAPGINTFEKATGIARRHWQRYWPKWSDLVREAELQPNLLQAPYTDAYLLEQLASFLRDLGRMPTNAEMRIRSREGEALPHLTTFKRHLGPKAEWARRLLEFAANKPDYSDVADIVRPEAAKRIEQETLAASTTPSYGWVYLIKTGNRYKVGKTERALEVREYELDLILPNEPRLIHAIQTDDPPGIEKYWHKRFADRHVRGEFFDLTADDVAAFRRRKKM